MFVLIVFYFPQLGIGDWEIDPAELSSMVDK